MRNSEAYNEKVETMKKMVVIPTFNETIKSKIIETIRRIHVDNSKEYLLNEVFNPESDLYKHPIVEIPFDIENVLSNINNDKGYENFFDHLYNKVDHIFFTEAEKLNTHNMKGIDGYSIFYDAIHFYNVDTIYKWLNNIGLDTIIQTITENIRDKKAHLPKKKAKKEKKKNKGYGEWLKIVERILIDFDVETPIFSWDGMCIGKLIGIYDELAEDAGEPSYWDKYGKAEDENI